MANDKALDTCLDILGAIYARVSTEEQTEYSIDAQINQIKSYAKANNIIIPSEYIFVDEGISGKSVAKRPAFLKMVATAKIKPKPFDIILVHKFDRFSRSREDSIVYKSLLRKECDVKVVSITESIEDDKFSVILEAMLEAMAEYYSLNLAEEVKKGMTEKAMRGEIQTKASFGYEMIHGQLVIVEAEARIVRYIFESLANGTLNTRQLVLFINELGIKTKQGNPFDTRQIDYIINNPLYIGKVRWTPSGRARRDFRNPDTIIRDGTHEAIISMDLWEQVQTVIKRNKELYPKHSRGNGMKIHSWVNGLVRCGNCNHTLVNSQDKYLQCSAYNKGRCKISCNVKYSVIEDVVLEELRKTFTEPVKIVILPKETENKASTEHDMLVATLENLRIKLERIKEAYQNGIDSLNEYKVNKELIEFHVRKTNEKLENLKNALTAPKQQETLVERVMSVYDLLTSPSVNIKEKYETAHFLIHQIIYTKQAQIVKLVFK